MPLLSALLSAFTAFNSVSLSTLLRENGFGFNRSDAFRRAASIFSSEDGDGFKKRLRFFSGDFREPDVVVVVVEEEELQLAVAEPCSSLLCLLRLIIAL